MAQFVQGLSLAIAIAEISAYGKRLLVMLYRLVILAAPPEDNAQVVEDTPFIGYVTDLPGNVERFFVILRGLGILTPVSMLVTQARVDLSQARESSPFARHVLYPSRYFQGLLVILHSFVILTPIRAHVPQVVECPTLPLFVCQFSVYAQCS